MFAKLLKRKQTPFISVNSHNCIACWKCIDICSKKVLGKVDFLGHRHIRIINSDACIGCNKCIQTCPKGVFKRLNK